MAEKLYMTALSPTMEQGTITEWHKAEGETIKNGDIICEVETDKAVMEYEADFDAVLLKIIVDSGQTAGIGDVIAVYGEAEEDYSQLILSDITAVEEPAVKVETPAVAVSRPSAPQGRRLKSSPLARKMAADLNIRLESVEGSGFDGRIIKRDIERTASGQIVPEANHISQTAAGAEYKAVGAMRRTIAERLSASKFTSPHYYLTLHADMSTIMAARKDLAARSGRKISINSFLIKLASSALKKHPRVNSSWEGDKIRAFGTADIGFAAALTDGLITPVIRNCESKGILVIDDEFRILAQKAGNGSLLPEEYSGAGFTISNLGSFGIEEFTAIINPPGSAILAVGAILKQPIVVTDSSGADAVVIKPMMKMTLSCDHRVIDGAVGAAFLSALKRMIEEPIEALF